MTIGPTNAAAQRVAGPHLIARAPIADGPDPDMGAIPMPPVRIGIVRGVQALP